MYKSKLTDPYGVKRVLARDISCICYRVLNFIVHNADPKRESEASSSQLYFFTGRQVWQFLSVKWALPVPDFIVVQHVVEDK